MARIRVIRLYPGNPWMKEASGAAWSDLRPGSVNECGLAAA
jgi:hypothetical protein